MAFAPKLPFDFKIPMTSFKTSWSISEIHERLDTMFIALSIQFTQSEEHELWFKCSASRIEEIEMTVLIFEDADQRVVSFKHEFGDRYAFYQLAREMSLHLQVPFTDGKNTLNTHNPPITPPCPF
jgi:hypothetical protein